MNATIQEIEGIDDYWGPAFRSVYEGEGHEAFVQQLDERITQHDKEIEKLCNFHYQKKRKRRCGPNKLRGICEDREKALQSSMTQYEGNNNHIPKRRCIDPKRLGGYINTFPEPGTQCEPSDPHSSSKVSDHNLYNDNLEETSDMGISSDEFEEITKYHTLQHQKLENHQLISKEADSSTDDLRLYLRNRNRLLESVDHHNLLIGSEQQSDYSITDSVDCLKSMHDQRPLDKEVDVNSANDLRSYLRSKLSDEQPIQNEQLHEHRRQSQPIQYDQRNNQQVDLDRDQRQFLSSKYKIGPWQYDDIRYKKGQSPTSVKHNKDQIRSLSTERRQNRHELIEYGKDQSKILSSKHTWRQSLLVAEHYEECQSSPASAKHDKGRGSLSSERNRTLSRHESFEKENGQRRHVVSEQHKNQNRKSDRQRDENRPKFAKDNKGQNLPEYYERYVRPSRPSTSEHYTSRNLYVNIESRQSPNSFKEHRPRSPHGTSERDGINGQRVFAHQIRGHHSAEYDSSDSYSRGEFTERPKIRSRPSSTESNYIRQSRPPSSENYKQRLHPFTEYQKGQNRKQTRGSQEMLSDYDRKSLSSHEFADFDRVQDRQALAKRRRIGKSLSSELNEREITAATMEYQRRERRHALSDKKSQTCPFSAEHVQSGQSTEYIRGQNRCDSLEGYENRPRSTASTGHIIRHNQLSFSEFQSQIRRHKSNECFSDERSSLLSDQFSGVQTDLCSVDRSARHNRSYVSAVLQRVDDRPLMSDISRQVSSETCTKQRSLLPETQCEAYRKSSDREELRRPLSTHKTPRSVEMCKSTVAEQQNSALGNIPTPSFEECPAMSSSSPLHSISNRVTSSQIFQNEILELELSHVERNDIENRESYDRPQKKADTTKLKSCYDGGIDASETVLISDPDTEISMDISSPRSIPVEKNAKKCFSNDLRSKLTNQLEASALLPTSGSSEPHDHSRESFAEISSIQDISGNNFDSVETVIVKSEPYDTSYDAISLNASNESLKVTESRLNQEGIAPERLHECHIKSELIYHDTNREISSPVDKNIAQNRLQQETPDCCHNFLLFPSQSCDTVTPSDFIKSEIKQESYNETLNTVQSTLETDLGLKSSCGPNDKDKLGQATAESSPASSNDGSFKVSVRDANTINLLLSGANVDPLIAVLNKTDESKDDRAKIDVSMVTSDSWYTPQKINFENYNDKPKNLSISALVNSSYPRLQRPEIKNTTIQILNEHKTEVIVEKDVGKSEINIESNNTVASKSKFITIPIDGQNEILKTEKENEPIALNMASKCGKLMLDNIPNSSKANCYSSNNAEISPESPQIQEEQLFTSLNPIDMESQVNPIPGYDPANKNHNIKDWIDSVNKVAAVCKWSDQQVVEYAISKIKGCDLNSNLSWSEWQEKLRTAFPPKVNYGKMLQDMLNTTAKVGDSLVEYYYEKKTLLDKCNITGEKAIECIIFGIEDESVRTILESLNFDNQEQLLTFLSNFKN